MLMTEVVQDSSEDDDDDKEEQPGLGDIPNNCIQELTGQLVNVKTENPLVAHGLKWTQVESISMDECTVQPKYAVINFPMGVTPQLGNFYLQYYKPIHQASRQFIDWELVPSMSGL